MIAQSLFAQKKISKLSYAEIDSLMLLEYQKADYEKAIAYLTIGRDRAKAEFGAMDSLYAEYTSNLGLCYSLVNRIEEAETLYLEVLGICKKVKGEKHPSYARILDKLGIFYNDLHQFKKAEEFYLKALAINNESLGNNDLERASRWSNLATLYQDMGQLEKAEQFFLKALDIVKDSTLIKGAEYGLILLNVGSLYLEMRHYEKSEHFFFLAKDNFLNSVGESHPYYVNVISYLGGLFQSMGDFEKAELFFSQAVDLDAKFVGKKDPYYAISLNNLAGLLEKMKAYQEAKKLYWEANEINKEVLGEEHPQYLLSLKRLSEIYIKLKDYEKAEKTGLDVKRITFKLYGAQGFRYGGALENLGLVFYEKKDFSQAEKLLLEAHKIYETTENPTFSITSASHLSALYYAMGDLEKALDYCLLSIKINRLETDAVLDDFSNFEIAQLEAFEYKFNYKLSESLEQLLKILEAQYDRTKDEKTLNRRYSLAKTAMKLNERFRNNLDGEKDKLRILRTNTFFIRHGLKTALLLEGALQKKEAFRFVEFNKSVLLLDAVKGSRARNLSDLPDSLIAKEIAYKKEYAALKKEQYEGLTPEEKSRATRQMSVLQLEMDVFLKEIKQKYPKYHQLKYENVTTNTDEIQALLDDETLFLEYFLTDSLCYIFAISKEEVKIYPIELTLAELKQQIQTLRFVLSDYNMILKKENQAYQMYTRTAAWFYDKILDIALKDKQYKNLIIVSDGELGHLPFETFLVKAPTQQNINYTDLHYLIKDYNISYNYSATLWKETALAPQKQNNGKLLACAPSYSKLDSSLLEIRLPHYYNLRNLLDPLPATEKEVTSLEHSFQGTFLKEEAANEKFFKENAQEYGIIHLAMHGVLNSRIPMLSSLVFSEDRDSVEDNFLQAYEISRLELNADLVVLSACETGYGKFEQGEGIVSLARSFMYAGVSSLVVSLWQVNDQSTEQIMKGFYQNLANGMNKAEALRASKLFYLEHAVGISKHPAFWSPFIQLGNSKPIQFNQTNKNTLVWSGLIGIALFFVGLLWLFRRRKEV